MVIATYTATYKFVCMHVVTVVMFSLIVRTINNCSQIVSFSSPDSYSLCIDVCSLIERLIDKSSHVYLAKLSGENTNVYPQRT